MKQLRPYLLVLLVVFPIVILVLMRALSNDNFKPDAYKLAEPSFTGANLLNKEQAVSLGGKTLIVKLTGENVQHANPSSDTLFIAADQLLNKENLRAIHSHRGPVLFVSDDPAMSAKAWMILSQMGYRDLYVLSDENDEALKYKFRPDTSAGI